MNIFHIAGKPTVINNVHESCYRDSALLNYVMWLLEKNTPPEVILALVKQVRAIPIAEAKPTKETALDYLINRKSQHEEA